MFCAGRSVFVRHQPQQVPGIVIENKPRYKLSGLARVGEFITFEASATNKGNVDVEDVAISNELFKSTGSEIYIASGCTL